MTRKLALGALSFTFVIASLVFASLPARAGTVTADGQTITTPDQTPTTTTPSDQGATGPSKPKSTPKKKKSNKKKSNKKKSNKKSPGEFLEEGKAKDKRESKKSKKNAKKKGAKKKDRKDKPELDPLGLGAAPVGVPSFVINRFKIPPFLLPVYQAAGSQYGVRWEVLAAINEIETDYGRNLNVSSAGALGWMQFMPSTWAAYGVDANEDGIKDPYNPVDAIFAAARYLKASGAETDLRQAIFAYNHANWYVDSVVMRARLVAGLPADLVGSLTGLTQGHFPVYATSRYEGNLSPRQARRLSRRTNTSKNAAKVITENRKRRQINIFSRQNAPVIAVNDGTIRKVGVSKKRGRYIVLTDSYGNDYTYAHLAKVSATHPVPRSTGESKQADEFRAANRKPKSKRQPAKSAVSARKARAVSASSAYTPPDGDPATTTEELGKERLFANPARAGNREQAEQQGQPIVGEAYEEFRVYFSRVLKLSPKEMELKPLKKGSTVIAGTVLGRIGQLKSGRGSKLAPHLNFSIRPAGKTAPRMDPKPILDGWKLLEATALYRAKGRNNPFVGAKAGRPSPGQALLMSKEALQRRVLADPYIDVYACGRNDIRTGRVDRRVLALLEYLASSGLHPTVTSLSCGHSYLTAAGGVSDHPFGQAVDIAAINGIPIYGNQGPGSITDIVIRKLMGLQGQARPYQIISLMDFGGPSFALGDHDDHIHVGFPSRGGSAGQKIGRQADAVLSRNQWDKFVSKLTTIQNPTVPTAPSRYSTKVKRGGKKKGNARDGG